MTSPRGALFLVKLPLSHALEACCLFSSPRTSAVVLRDLKMIESPKSVKTITVWNIYDTDLKRNAPRLRLFRQITIIPSFVMSKILRGKKQNLQNHKTFPALK